MAKKGKPKAKKKKAAVRGSGFTSAETEAMLGTVEDLLPLCLDEWVAVLAEHNKLLRDQMRTVDSLKRKFATLHRKKMPTGDPLMPEEVRKAKHIRYKMTEGADLGCGDEESDLITGIGTSSGDEIEETRCSPEPTPVAVSTESTDDMTSSFATSAVSTRPQASLPSPRPLIAKRKDASSQSFRVDDILNMIKMTMIQEQQRRVEDLRRREEEKIRREEERREERQRRENESKRQERYFEALLMMMASRKKTRIMESNSDVLLFTLGYTPKLS